MITINLSDINSVRVEVKIIGANSSLMWEQLQCQTRLDLIKVLNIFYGNPLPFSKVIDYINYITFYDNN